MNIKRSLEMYETNDILLNVISVKKEISWAEYTKIYSELCSTYLLGKRFDSGLRYKRLQTIRALDALGHCEVEFSKDERTIVSAPPLITRLPEVGLPKAILAGSRMPRTIDRLKNVSKSLRAKVMISVQPSGYFLVPQCVLIEADRVKDLSEIAQSLGTDFESQPAAWSIIDFAASLDQQLAKLRWSERRDLNWTRHDFNFDLLMFTHSHDFKRAVRLSRYNDPISNVNLYLLWKGNACAEVDGDWGRYAALKEAGINVVAYDANQFEFLVPVTVPLPKLIARALTLCSGLLPEPRQQHASVSLISTLEVAVYKNVPPPIAELAAIKLGQTISLSNTRTNI